MQTHLHRAANLQIGVLTLVPGRPHEDPEEVSTLTLAPSEFHCATRLSWSQILRVRRPAPKARADIPARRELHAAISPQIRHL
jgi:hypothetical protein